MNAYAAIYIKTTAYIRTAKALKKLFESDPMFRENRFDIYLNSNPQEKNVCIFPENLDGTATEAVAKAISGIIDAIIIAFYGDDQSIGISLYRNGATLVHYLYANGRVISEQDKYSLIPILVPFKDTNYSIQSSHFMWDNCFDQNPPVELKDHLDRVVAIRGGPPTQCYIFKVNPELSWPQATVYDRAPIIPLSDPAIEALFRRLLAAAEETHTAVPLDKYAGEVQIAAELIESYHIQWVDPHISGYWSPYLPRRPEGSQAYFIPDPEGKSADWNDGLPRFEDFVIPDHVTYAAYHEKYFYTAYVRLGLALNGVDGQKNGYYCKGNKLYIFPSDMTACKVETLTGGVAEWFLNVHGEMCVHTVSEHRGILHSTRIYRIPLPHWEKTSDLG